jgi:uncharacterized membrane protein YeiH
VVAIGAALLLFWLHPHYNRLRRTTLLLDAAGLGLFTVTSTVKALDAGIPAIGSCLIGMIAAIGGGLGRDLLTGEIPYVLRREIYAVVALGGAAVVAALLRFHAPVTRSVLLGVVAVLIFLVRVLAVRNNWEAPVPRDAPGDPGAGNR